MSFRKGDRYQTTLFPPSIEELVPEDSPVRVYNAFVDALDLEELGISTDDNRIGNPCYEPRAMLKLLVYGYSYGVRSSRKLEREVHNNISFIWLMSGLKPDHKTIAEFRRNNKKALQNILKASAHVCLKLGLIAGNTLFVDGTKIRSNASIKSSRSEKQCRRDLARVEKRIEEIIDECESVDESESGMPSYVKIPDSLLKEQAYKAKIEEAMAEMKASGRKSHNRTDPDSTRVYNRQGVTAGYNAQIVVDEKHSLIVSSDVTGESNDLGQLSSQVDLAHEVLGGKSETVCADSGYDNPSEMEKVADKGIRVIVPPQQPKTNREVGVFDKSNFTYDEENDCYICPAGEILEYYRYNKTRKAYNYRTRDRSVCRECPYYDVCTKSKDGRTVQRFEKEKLREKFEAEYNTPESQEVYKLRSQNVEHPFGHIKRNLGAGYFLLRGRDGVKAEMSLLSTCFNLRRMMTILGLKQTVSILQRNSILQH